MLTTVGMGFNEIPMIAAEWGRKGFLCTGKRVVCSIFFCPERKGPMAVLGKLHK